MEGLSHNPRIGIFGGSFNPIHMGHLILAQDALELFELNKIIFVPCACPPHKPAKDLAPADHRLSMIEAALEGDLRMEVSDIEIRRGGVSYSVDTAREIRRMNPEAEVVFVVGSDSLPELHQWKDIGQLLELCRFVALARPGTDLRALENGDLKLDEDSAREIRRRIRVGHCVSISSTDIRYRVAEGMGIRYLVHPAVEMYITEHSLYRR